MLNAQKVRLVNDSLNTKCKLYVVSASAKEKSDVLHNSSILYMYGSGSTNSNQEPFESVKIHIFT
jgi:hypothetical protein